MQIMNIYDQYTNYLHELFLLFARNHNDKKRIPNLPIYPHYVRHELSKISLAYRSNSFYIR